MGKRVFDSFESQGSDESPLETVGCLPDIDDDDEESGKRLDRVALAALFRSIGVRDLRFDSSPLPDRARQWLGRGLEGDPDRESELDAAEAHWEYYRVRCRDCAFGVLFGHDALFDLHGTGVTGQAYGAMRKAEQQLDDAFVPIGDAEDVRVLLKMLDAARQ